MIVAVSRSPLPKTERYLYWVRVAFGREGLGFRPLMLIRRA